MAEHAIVEIRSGKIRGASVDGVHSFKGVPYAAAPFGANHLKPPSKVEAWSGVRDAVAYGPKAPQEPYPPSVDVLLPEFAIPGADCLNLNIWSRDLGLARQPVMVWIPGGMFEFGTGASPWYDGSRFARDGIVCVTINYRVGAEGFLYVGDDIANLGLLDQIAALTWVKENITAFGGDPDNVTVFGESAGAMSIGALLSMPRANGLFRRAIAQSGAAHHAIQPADALRVSRRLAEKLGVPSTRAALAAVSVDRVIQAQAELRSELAAQPDPERWGAAVAASMLPWQPVIDGRILPARPIDSIVAGVGGDVDVLIGTNTDDWRLFLVSSGAIDHVGSDALAAAAAAYGLPVETALNAYRAANPHGGSGDLLAAIQTDWWCRIPAIRLADAHAKGAAATYMYEFAWRSPQFDGALGACHALEIPFVFDTLGSGTEPLLGPTPPQELASAMHAAWIAFATRGDCGWPKYDLQRRATMRFNIASEVVDDPRRTERALWEGIR